MPYEGMANTMDGQNSVLSVVGPLGTSVGALKLVMKGILSQKPWLHDPLVLELPWREDAEQEVLNLIQSSTIGNGKLAFGLLRHDGVVTPQPPVARALDIVCKTLERLGHKVYSPSGILSVSDFTKVIDWQPPSHRKLNDLAVSTTSSVGA